MNDFENRKKDHIRLALDEKNQANATASWESLRLRHEAIPDFNFEDIDLSSQRFSKPIRTPFFVSSMTAGHKDAPQINAALMEACEATGWAMGVGSQRRELSDKKAAFEWAPLRSTYPKVSLFSNIGLAQIIHTPLSTLCALLDSIQAEALIVHTNPLQECIQPEGTPQYKGAWDALAALVKALPCPVIVKETGCGFSAKTLTALDNIGVHAIDLAGLGGTHWGRIEGGRASAYPIQHSAAETFKDWGIPTSVAMQEAKRLGLSCEVWGSGGVANGLNAAKLIALGASSIGFAKPLLAEALLSSTAVIARMQAIEYELKVAMFCTGSINLAALSNALE